MLVFRIEDEDGVYTVRKEDIGCSIFTPQNFVEGDDMLFDVLRVIHEKGVPAGIEELKTRYQAEAGQVEADLRYLAECFLASNIFRSLSRQVQLYVNERSAP